MKNHQPNEAVEQVAQTKQDDVQGYRLAFITFGPRIDCLIQGGHWSNRGNGQACFIGPWDPRNWAGTENL